MPSGSIPLARAGGGERKSGRAAEGNGSPETCCRSWERCLAEVCLLPTFPFYSCGVFFSFFFFFKVLATVTGAMKVNTLQLLLLFSYHPADPGPEPAVVNDYRAPVRAPGLTLPSCLTLT